MNTPTTGFSVDADVNPFEAAMRRMVDAAKQGEGGVGAALAGLGGPLAGLKVAFGVLSGFASGAFLKEAIQATTQMTEKAMDLSRALGVSTNEARVVQMALEDIGADAGEFESAAKGMVKQLRENEKAMNAMGLVTRDAAGNLRPMNDLVTDGIQVLGEYKEGTDRAVVSKKLFGKGIEANSKLMLYNKEVVDENRAAMQELGLEVGENSVAAWKAFDAQADRAGFGLKGLKKAVGDALLPVLTTLTEVFNSIMPAAITVVKGALAGLTGAFLALRTGVIVVFETLNALVIIAAEPIRALAEAIYKAVNGDFAGAGAVLKNVGNVMSNAVENAMQRSTAAARKSLEEITGILLPDSKAGSGGGPKGTRTAPVDDDDEEDDEKKAAKAEVDKDTSVMQTYEQALEYTKLFYERQNALRSYSKEQELAYWKELLDTYEVGNKDREKIASKIAKLEIDTLRQSAKEQKEITQLRAEDWKAETLDYIAELQARAQFDREQGTLTQAQYLERLAAFHAMRLQAEMEFISQKIEIAKLDPENNLVLLEQLEMQKAEIRRRFAEQSREVARQQAAEQMGPINAISASIGASLSRVAESLLTSWKNVGKALKAAVRDIGMAIIQETILKPLQARVVAFAKERLLTLAGIGADAAKAGSGAASSQAGIPIIGPFLALASMASIMAAVGGLSAKVPSASMGFDVPAGLNPLTQLHEQEMVLPKEQADVIRSMAGGGGGGGGDTYNVYAMDSRSFEQFLKDNPAALSAGNRHAAKRGFN